MSFTVIVRDEFFSIDDRVDVLKNAALQRAIAAVRRQTILHPIRCGCGIGHVADERLPVLEPFPEGYLHRLDRRSQSDIHWDQNCPFVLGTHLPQLPQEKHALALSNGDACRSHFRSAVRLSLSAAIATAFSQLCRGKSYWGSFHSALDENLRTRGLFGWSLHDAAERRGVELIHGIIPERWIDQRLVTYQFRWRAERIDIKPIAMPRELWVSQTPLIQMADKLIGPPYYFFALVRGHQVAAFTVFAAYYSVNGLHLVESWYERWRLHQLTATNEIVYKPTRIDHLNLVWNELKSLRGLQGGAFDFRPDFFRIPRQTEFIVEELRGVPPCLTKPSLYDLRLGWKESRTPQVYPQFVYHESKAYELDEPDWVPYPIHELGLQVHVSDEFSALLHERRDGLLVKRGF